MAYIGSPAAPTIATVSDDTITTAKLADDAVTSAKLVNDAVTSAKITDGAVTPSDLSTGHPNWDSSGNVGIGTSNSPSNKNTVTPTLNVSGSGVAGSAQITRHTSVGSGGALLHLSATRGSDVNSYTVLQSGDGIGTLVFQGADGGEFVVGAEISAAVDSTPGDDDMPTRLMFKTTADGASASTERMRIDSSGNVGIGTGSPGEKLDVQGNIRLTGGDTYVKFINAGGYDFSIRSDSGNALRFYSPEYSGTPGISMLNNLDVLYGGTGYPANGTAGTLIQNGRIDISRNSDYCLQLRRFNNDGQVAFFFRDANNVGNIAVNNSSTSYNSASDYRLKENVVEVTDGISRVKLLKPSRFNFIVDPDKTVDGFLAHEVADVVPEAITGTKDAMRTEDVYDEDGNVTGTQEVPEYQGIDQSKLVPLLTAALQEAIAKIELLEARVATLESA